MDLAEHRSRLSGLLEAKLLRARALLLDRDPVAAFVNIRRSLKPTGRLTFVCWRALKQNPWMQAPLEAALPLLPPMAPSDPTAPGPFAFADAGRVEPSPCYRCLRGNSPREG